MPPSVADISPIWHPFTQHATSGPMIEIVRAEGAWLHAADGRRSSMRSRPGGSIRTATVIRRSPRRSPSRRAAGAGDLRRLHPSAGRAARPQASGDDAARAGVRLLPDSGSTAVEVGVKMAVGYWHNLGRPRHRVAAFEHGYHGDTFGAMSVGARGVFNRPYQPMLFDVDFLPFPAPGREQRDDRGVRGAAARREARSPR